MSSITIKSNIRVFNGQLIRFSHESSETKCVMTVAVYLPYVVDRLDVSYNAGIKTPAIMYLSGLTCTDENVCQKSGVFKYLAENQVAFIAPDTSPRGANIQGEDDSWDFGTGAGFYLDATEDPWSNNYRMYSYVTKELLSVIKENFPTIDLNKMGITGHSMGGHGALTIAIKNPTLFKTVSAFSPICNPSQCPWGIKAFSGYLGADNKEAWKNYDATELIKRHGATQYHDILIDVGTADSFLTGGQLLPQEFAKACDREGQRLTLRYQEGYDHSYFFISSFIEDHILFHANRLLVKDLDANAASLYT